MGHWAHLQEDYREQGFVIVERFFSPGEIQEAAASQDRFYLGQYDRKPEFSWPLPRPCRSRTRKHPYASFYLSSFDQMLRDGRLATLIKEVCSLSSLRFWHDQLLYEEPCAHKAIDYHWHREQSRWLTCEATAMVTAWIPLTEFTQEMGPITLIASKPDHQKEYPMTLQSGDLVLFDQTLLHGNPPNRGTKVRRAIAAHYASGDLTYRSCGRFSHVNERIVRQKNHVPDFTDERVCPKVG